MRPAEAPVTLRHLLAHTGASATTPGMSRCSATRPLKPPRLPVKPGPSCSSQARAGSMAEVWIRRDGW